MIRIAVTPPEIFPGEAEAITTILDAGWDKVHLRHPSASIRDMRNLIEAIPQRYHRKLRLHGHFSLTDEFNLGGLHLNSRCPIPPDNYTGPLSLTCHSAEEVIDASDKGLFDYVTLSPIFDSLSKSGYRSAFSSDEIARITSSASVPVIALGGVTPGKIHEIKTLGFDGFAVLGYLADAAIRGTLSSALNNFDENS